MKHNLLIIVFFVNSIFAQQYYENILTPESSSWGDSYGWQAQVENGFLVTFFNSSSGGGCKFFHFENQEWVFNESLSSGTLSRMQQQLGEDFYLLSTHGYLTPNNYPGEIYVRSVQDYNLSYENTIHNPDPENYNFFGNDFFRNDNFLITVSEHRENIDRKYHFYNIISGEWVLEKSVSSDFQFGVTSDNSLYINENISLVGNHHFAISDSNQTGAIQIYKRNNNEWIFNSTLFSPNPVINSKFGLGLKFKNNHLFVSAPFENNGEGALYIFEYILDEFIFKQRLNSHDIEQNDNFGSSFDMNENYLIVASKYDSDAGPGSGSVYIFELGSDGLWAETRKVYASDAESLDLFGSTISINDSYFVVSAPFKNNLTGAIYTYKLSDTMLHANFATYPVTGNAPLSLTFNDLSQGNPTSWQWDFDSDGIIDSEDQYPEHTYEFSGDYTVTLTVTNEEETSTFTKENYVSVSGGLAYGDVNGDTAVDVIDIVIMVDVIMGEIEPTTTQIEAADMNNSGTIDVIDIVLVVNEIMGN